MGENTNFDELCQKDRNDKLALLKSAKEHINAKKEEFGLEYMTPETSGLDNPTDGILKGIFSTHKDFNSIANAVKNGKPWAIVSGINPSGPIHLGHLSLFRENASLQKLGADIFIPLSNDESFLFDKAESLAQAEEIAWKSIIPSIIAMGFDPEKTHIYIDTDFSSIYTLAIHAAKHFSLTHVKGVFGFEDDVSPAYAFYLGGIQMAHILMPQLAEFGGPRPTLVPVGIDQHPYIQVSRRFARRFNFVPPAELNLKFLPSLGGPSVKMSASQPNSCIYVTDDMNVVKKKIKTAYTGGSPVLKYQQEYGGIPDVCSIFGILQYHLLNPEETKELHGLCESGIQKCKDCKERTLAGLEILLMEHQNKCKQALDIADKFMLKKPVTSFRYLGGK